MDFVTNEGGAMEENRGNLLKKTIWLFWVAVIMVLIGVVVITQTKSTRFVKALTKKQYVYSHFGEALNQMLQNGENEITLRVNGQFLQAMSANQTDVSEDIIVSGTILKQAKDLDVVFLASLGEIILQSGEIIKNKETYAMTFPFLFREWAAFHQENSQMVAQRLGLIPEEASKEEKAYIEKGGLLLKKYAKIAMGQVNHYIEVENHQAITIHQKEYQTKRYRLSLSHAHIKEMVESVLKELKEDEEAISYLVDILIKVSPKNEELSKEQEIIQLQSNIQKAYERLRDDMTNYDSKSILTIDLYQKGGNTIRTDLIVDNQGHIVYSFTSVDNNIELAIEADGTKVSYLYTGKGSSQNFEGRFYISTSGITVDIAKLEIRYQPKSSKTIRKISEMEVLWIDEEDEKNAKLIKSQLTK